MHERLALTDSIAKQYQQSTKKEKGELLTTFCRTTGYNRKYAIRLLSTWGKVKLVRMNGKLIRVKAGGRTQKAYPERSKIYDEPFQRALVKIWEFSDFMCGKRLVAFIKVIAIFIRDNELYAFTDEIWRKLMQVSAASIDRLLQPERKKYQIKGRSRTRPGAMLKQDIPIRTFADWDEAHPGFLEIDLVSHEGGNASGDFCFTLTATDVATGWTEVRGIQNKAQKWTVEALDHIVTTLPFPVLGVDSDNGSEFINAHLKRYCEKHHITFTRSRPYRKNDNCFVEQKNDLIVRRTAGYLRYDTDDELVLLNQMYESVRLWVNFFHPSVKLISKTRTGAKVKKIYDAPLTPYQRIMASDQVAATDKEHLSHQFTTLDPIKLQRTVETCKTTLQDMVSVKNQRKLSFT
jgi:hypothetical protein